MCLKASLFTKCNVESDPLIHFMVNKECRLSLILVTSFTLYSVSWKLHSPRIKRKRTFQWPSYSPVARSFLQATVWESHLYVWKNLSLLKWIILWAGSLQMSFPSLKSGVFLFRKCRKHGIIASIKRYNSFFKPRVRLRERNLGVKVQWVGMVHVHYHLYELIPKCGLLGEQVVKLQFINSCNTKT